MNITYQSAWIHQLRKHLVEREGGIRLVHRGFGRRRHTGRSH